MLSNQVPPLKNISDKFKRVDSTGILKLFDLHTVLLHINSSKLNDIDRG